MAPPLERTPLSRRDYPSGGTIRTDEGADSLGPRCRRPPILRVASRRYRTRHGSELASRHPGRPGFPPGPGPEGGGRQSRDRATYPGDHRGHVSRPARTIESRPGSDSRDGGSDLDRRLRDRILLARLPQRTPRR